MFSKKVNYTKLKTNLKLAVNRMKLLEKKKTELTQKARKEIADYIQEEKIERAKIRVEQIIREDYLVEALEVVEIYCDMLIARFGLVTQVAELDENISEAVSSILWSASSLQSDIPEIKVIADIFELKYGKLYANSCREGSCDQISEKLKRKLSIQTPPKPLVEKYMVAIAKSYDLIYEPDPELMREDKEDLIDFTDKTNVIGFIGCPMPPVLPQYTMLQQSDLNPAPLHIVSKSTEETSTEKSEDQLSKEDQLPSPLDDDNFDFEDLNRRFEKLKNFHKS